MKHLKVTSACTMEAERHALQLYREHAARGLHVLMVGQTQINSHLTVRRLSQCDVLITVHSSNGPLFVEEKL